MGNSEVKYSNLIKLCKEDPKKACDIISSNGGIRVGDAIHYLKFACRANSKIIFSFIMERYKKKILFMIKKALKRECSGYETPPDEEIRLNIIVCIGHACRNNNSVFLMELLDVFGEHIDIYEYSLYKRDNSDVYGLSLIRSKKDISGKYHLIMDYVVKSKMKNGINKMIDLMDFDRLIPPYEACYKRLSLGVVYSLFLLANAGYEEEALKLLRKFIVFYHKKGDDALLDKFSWKYGKSEDSLMICFMKNKMTKLIQEMIFLKKGCESDYNRDGDKPLYIACKSGMTGVALQLLEIVDIKNYLIYRLLEDTLSSGMNDVCLVILKRIKLSHIEAMSLYGKKALFKCVGDAYEKGIVTKKQFDCIKNGFTNTEQYKFINGLVESEERQQIIMKKVVLECVVCTHELDELMMIEPCGHGRICRSCILKIDDCPLCRKKIKGYKKVYL